MTVPGFTVRLAEPSHKGELAWILKRWYSCDRKTAAARAEGSSYPGRQRRRMQGCLSAPGAYVLVAHAYGDEDALAGFLVACGGVLHYVYVRRLTQRLGIARELCRYLPEQVRCSHQPVDSSRHLPKGWTYEGYRLCAYARS